MTKTLFRYHNANPKGRKHADDCVLRALATATGRSYTDVFETLVKIARKRVTTPTCRISYREYLEEYQPLDVFYEDCHGRHRYTVEDICDWEGAYVVAIANHLTAVVDGHILDTWDCGEKCAYQIWKVR